MIECYRLDLESSDDRDVADLDDAERERAARFKFAVHRTRFIAAHAQARRILGAWLDIAPARVPLATTQYGKPILAAAAGSMAGAAARERSFCFNLTHSNAVGYLAIAPFNVGIDLELTRPIADLQPLIDSYCSAREIAALAVLSGEARAAGFLGIWTRKEAVLKAWGTGIGAVPLNEVHVGLDTESVSALKGLPQQSLHDPSRGSQPYPALRVRTLAQSDQILSIAAATEQPLVVRMVPAGASVAAAPAIPAGFSG